MDEERVQCCLLIDQCYRIGGTGADAETTAEAQVLIEGKRAVHNLPSTVPVAHPPHRKREQHRSQARYRGDQPDLHVAQHELLPHLPIMVPLMLPAACIITESLP